MPQPPNDDNENEPNPVNDGDNEGIKNGRAERVRLLSTDGLADPRNDRTSLDADFAIFNDLSAIPETFLPRANPRDENEIEPGIRFLDLYRTMLPEIEGRVDYPVEFAMIP